MIIIQLTGGLGNQMFQYAVGKALAYRLGTELYLDKTHFLTTPTGKKNIRQYELHHFNIKEQFKKPAFHWIKKYLKAEKMYARLQTFKEQHVHIHPEVFELGDNTYLEGTYQAEKYFKPIEDILRNEFTFKTPPAGKNAKLAEKISSVNAISVHIRRGDYVSNPETLQSHGICSIEYYQQAVLLMEKRVKNPYFFLFSDEPEWVLQNFKMSQPCTIVSHNNGENSFEDMRLMSLCKHNIMANSSFSWWGAWLNSNIGKIIVAPRQWFVNPEWESKDILPDNWIKI